MKLNKNVIIAILLLTVFAVGTTCFVDTVEAAKLKKFDSGSYTTDNPDPGCTKKVTFVSYIKGSKDIKIVLYGTKSKNNKKVFGAYGYLSKTAGKMKFYIVDSKGKKSKPSYSPKTDMGVKEFYKYFIGSFKNVNSYYLKSGSNYKTVLTGSGSTNYVPRYHPAEMGMVYNSYTDSYTWGVKRQGYWA